MFYIVLNNMSYTLHSALHVYCRHFGWDSLFPIKKLTMYSPYILKSSLLHYTVNFKRPYMSSRELFYMINDE